MLRRTIAVGGYAAAAMLIVKKYPNRRLYDTRDSRYITLEDLEKTIRKGEDIVVQDASDGRDLTQEVLTQIILERGNGRLLPAALLMRLIRLDDAALGEFLTRYVSWALDMYLQVKDRTTSLFNRNPLAAAPFAAADALARMALDASPYGRMQRQAYPVPPAPVPAPTPVPPPPEPARSQRRRGDSAATIFDADEPVADPVLHGALHQEDVAPQSDRSVAPSVEAQVKQLREQIEALKHALVREPPAAPRKKRAMLRRNKKS